MEINEYFTDEELACRCGCGKMPDVSAVERLYALRMIYGKPIPITSAARCAKHNKNVSGTRRSRHIRGIAFDCIVSPIYRWEFIKIAQACGFHGIGVYLIFIHIDARVKSLKAVWTKQ